MGKDELLTVNCPVCGKKLLRTKQGEIEIQCPKCKQMTEAVQAAEKGGIDPAQLAKILSDPAMAALIKSLTANIK